MRGDERRLKCPTCGKDALLEHLCRYVVRPPIATERLSLRDDGKVVYALRRPWKDGTTHFVFDPLTFLERLAALIPRPRAHVLTYHGVLAPVASSAPEEPPRASAPPHRYGWSELALRRPAQAHRHDHRRVRRAPHSRTPRTRLSSEPPPVAPARAPPQGVLGF